MESFIRDGRVPFVYKGSNGPYVEHYHYEFEYWYMIDGAAKVRVGNALYDLLPGQVFLSFPFVRHEYICDGGNLSMVGVFSPSDAPEFSDILLECRPECPVIDTKDMYPGFGETLERFGGYFMDRWNDRRTGLIMFGAILCEMLSRVSLKKRADVSYSAMERLVLFCLRNYTDQTLTLEKASAALGYNRNHISRLLSQGLGGGFTKFLNSIRIDKSYSLLRQTDMPITAIALECGFGSIRNFNRAFSDFTGMTPSDFRHQWNGDNYFDYYERNSESTGNER